MVDITPRGSAPADQVWAWARGDGPLSLHDSRNVGPLQGLAELGAEAMQEQYAAELPQTERRLRAHPLVQQATQVLSAVSRLELPDGMAPSLIELELQRVRHAVGRLAVELDAAEVEYDAWMADGEGTDVQAVQVPAGALRLEVPVHRDSVEDDAGRAQVDSASEPLVEVIVDRELAAVDVHAAVQAGERVRQVAESSPKTKKGIRTLSLDAGTVEVLRAHRVRQAAARLAWGAACVDSGLVITMETAADCSRSTSLDCSRKRAATVASR